MIHRCHFPLGIFAPQIHQFTQFMGCQFLFDGVISKFRLVVVLAFGGGDPNGIRR
jgi:hypothetical protein